MLHLNFNKSSAHTLNVLGRDPTPRRLPDLKPAQLLLEPPELTHLTFLRLLTTLRRADPRCKRDDVNAADVLARPAELAAPGAADVRGGHSPTPFCSDRVTVAKIRASRRIRMRSTASGSRATPLLRTLSTSTYPPPVCHDLDRNHAAKIAFSMFS
jgi:hypothetical protein